MKIQQGDIVLYGEPIPVLNKADSCETNPGIVYKVWPAKDGEKSFYVGLHVFSQKGTRRIDCVPYNETPKEEHWSFRPEIKENDATSKG